ncbi:uroporphyrinogen-III synthase [Variovorax dokdonensis]|uniref:Uroporphyrinogen-III synthase n=1 Tax=Variovorax dokdonensis TaxID=344883 RepID=A0ABT7N6M8_9BURK|nr:uroporphyrinogen-III synthase [Variovorax dokdonensis]
MPQRRVLVTRPVHEARRWLDGLRAQGFDAQALPLITIAPLQDTTRLDAVRADALDFKAWMFVSAAAVRHFLNGDARLVASDGPRCWATGPGTVAALRDAGVPRHRIDAPDDASPRFDSEALWPLVAQQVSAGTRVLLVRGAGEDDLPAGRDWLAGQIEAAGGQAHAVAAYRRTAPSWDEALTELARSASSDGTIWLFSSSQAVANLRQLLPDVDWKAACAICTHPRIGDAASAAGFGRVQVANAPLKALAASIESFA